MPVVKMPDGALVEMPDNPSPEQLAELEKLVAAPAPEAHPTRSAAKRGALLGLTDTAKLAETVPVNPFLHVLAKWARPQIEPALASQGLTPPQDRGGRMVEALTRGLASGATVGAPGAGAVSSMASQGAEEAGAPWWGQLMAGLAGGQGYALGKDLVRSPVVTKTLKAPVNFVKPWTQGGRDTVKGELLNKLTEGRRPQVLAGLDENRQIVPGAQNTAATAGAYPARSTELAGAERLLSKKYDPSGYADIEHHNELAKAALRASSVTGTQAPADPRIPAILAPKRVQDAKQAQSAIRAFDERVKQTAKLATKGQAAAAERIAPHMSLPPSGLNRPLMYIRYALHLVQTGTNDRVLKELTQDLKDPAKVAHLMRQVPVKEQQTFLDLVQRFHAEAARGSLPTVQQSLEN